MMIPITLTLWRPRHGAVMPLGDLRRSGTCLLSMPMPRERSQQLPPKNPAGSSRSPPEFGYQVRSETP